MEINNTKKTKLNDDIRIFKRKNSNVWQAEHRVKIGDWRKFSTKECDYEKACKAAIAKHAEIRYLIKNNIVVTTAKFNDVANLTIKQLKAEQATGKTINKDYITAIKLYLIPCFKNTLIHKIDSTALLKLERAQIHADGTRLAYDSIATHNTALNRVFDVAVERGYMHKADIPKLLNSGAKGKARPAFNKEEYELVYTQMRIFANTGHKQITREIRELLRDYILILANTGMRTGDEALSLRWKDIKRINVNSDYEVVNDGDKGLQFNLTHSKTGARSLIATDFDNNTTRPLMRIAKRFPELAQLSEKELFKRNEYVFRLRSDTTNTVVNHGPLSNNFKQFLQQEHVDIEKDNEGEIRTLYSFRHMYATNKIIAGTDVMLLATQMGTSISMLEKHYSKLKAYMRRKELNGELMSALKVENAEVTELKVQLKKAEERNDKLEAKLDSMATMLEQLLMLKTRVA
jgi:integrase